MIPVVLPASAAEPAADFRSYVDQARFFVRRGWYADAAEQLELAVATPDGALDAEAWLLLATVDYALCDLERARDAADRAVVHARDEAQAARGRDLLAFLDQTFGVVRITSPSEGVVSRVDVERTSALVDPDLKRWLKDQQDQLSEPRQLPFDVWLPDGEYRLNGEAVVVRAGERAEASVPLRGAPRALQVTSVEIGAGAWVPLGPEVAHELPAPVVAASIGVPLGPLSVGVTGSFGVQTWRTDLGDLDLSASLLGLGARIGADLPAGPLVVRTSATWRAASLPGWALACARGDGAWTCDPSGEVRQLAVYAPVYAQLPGVELAALWQDRRRASGLGAGLKATGEWVLGRTPASGHLVLDGERLPYTLAEGADRGATHPALTFLAVATYRL